MLPQGRLIVVSFPVENGVCDLMMAGHHGDSLTMRFAAGIEYNGARFHGWQIQRGVPSVQAEVEQALGKVADHPIRVHCAGRTDAGVHSLAQVVHFDTGAVREPRNWLMGVNVHLPEDVAVLWVQPVRDDFHARFSATSRSYRYLVLNRPSRPGLMARRVTWVHRTLDVEKMHESAQALLGTHDFTSYRALACQAKHPVRTITRISVVRHGELVELRITANAFLHHMVRNIAGVLLAVGRGEAPVSRAAEVLGFRDRSRGEVTAPADGLYFAGVSYPGGYGLPDCSGAEWRLPW